mmetsp:Transcript_16975/g.23754  ORF Transcript_16975/g.23754 Transcript_16975/m.23754 type:complete len:247 (-) Transcript_16975:346-1086(-)
MVKMRRAMVLVAIFGLVVFQPQLNPLLQHGSISFPTRRKQRSPFLHPLGMARMVRNRRRSEIIRVMSFKGGEDISENDGSRDGRARQLRKLSKKDPEKVVEFLIEALRTNVYNDGNIEPYAADDGLALLYSFSTIDPWKPSEYFGVRRDLGQFERFRLMMYSDPFKYLINHKNCDVAASARPTRRHFVSLLRVTPKNDHNEDKHGRKELYFFFLSLRQQTEGPHRGRWIPEKLFPTTHPESDPAWM